MFRNDSGRRLPGWLRSILTVFVFILLIYAIVLIRARVERKAQPEQSAPPAARTELPDAEDPFGARGYPDAESFYAARRDDFLDYQEAKLYYDLHAA